MASSATVLTDDSKLSFLDLLYAKLERWMTLAGGMVILMLVVLAVVNVIGRWVFDEPVDGYIDWVEQAMAFMAFLGISYTQRIGGHIRMDMIISTFKGRVLWFVELLSSVVMLLVTIVLTYGAYLHFYRAYSIGDSSLDIELPTWPAKLIVPVALTVLSLRLVLQIWAYFRALRTGVDAPVAIPLIEDAATAAAREAATVSSSKEH